MRVRPCGISDFVAAPASDEGSGGEFDEEVAPVQVDDVSLERADTGSDGSGGHIISIGSVRSPPALERRGSGIAGAALGGEASPRKHHQHTPMGAVGGRISISSSSNNNNIDSVGGGGGAEGGDGSGGDNTEFEEFPSITSPSGPDMHTLPVPAAGGGGGGSGGGFGRSSLYPELSNPELALGVIARHGGGGGGPSDSLLFESFEEFDEFEDAAPLEEVVGLSLIHI